MGLAIGWLALSILAAGAGEIGLPRAELPPPRAGSQYFAKLSIAQKVAGRPDEVIGKPSFLYVEGADARVTSDNISFSLECDIGVRVVDGKRMHRVHGSITHHATETSPKRVTKFNLLAPNGGRDRVLTDDGLLVELEAEVHRPKP